MTTQAPALETALLFGKWDLKGVTVTDPGLVRYINLEPIFIPHTAARHANRPFGKAKVSVVERLINNMMRTMKYTGKKSKAYDVVRDAFDVIAEKTKQNPVQVLVKAIEGASPREEVTRLKYGGISVPKAVDSAPARRVDVAIRNMTTGACNATHKSKKPVHECLADEILKASKRSPESYAVAKRDEVERVAKSAR